MRFNIVFELAQPGQMLPLSYQYELASWLYGRISDGNEVFGQFLHTEGYITAHKRFKFFTFSNLWVPQYKILDDRMVVQSPNIELLVSFLVPEAAQHMVMGIFKNQQFRLGDRISQVALRVKEVEMSPLPKLEGDTFRLRAISPIFVSQPETDEYGKLRHQYLHPHDQHYATYLINNLWAKYETACKYELCPAIDRTANIKLKIIGEKIRKRGITIKAFTPEALKLIGYQYDFELTAPPELVRLGLLAGFGGNNSMGFGACRVLK